MSRRTLTLETANKLITQDRAKECGTAHANFTCIAALWSAYLAITIKPHEVAIMMNLLKVARTVNSPQKQDSYDDMCGYSALAAELAIGELTDDEKTAL